MKLNSRQPVREVALACIAIALTGCGTPKPVLKLAADTGARTSQLAGRLSEFADAKAALGELRAENMATTLRQFKEVEFEQMRRMEAARLSGDTQKLGLYSDLVAASERLAVMKSGIASAVEQERALFLASQSQLKPPVADLNRISQSLAALAKEKSVKEWILYYAGVAQQVDAIVQQKQKQLDAAAKQAAAANKKGSQ